MSNHVTYTREQYAQLRAEEMVEHLEHNRQRTEELVAEQMVRESDRRKVLWLSPVTIGLVIIAARLADHRWVWGLAVFTIGVAVVGTTTHLLAYQANTTAADARLQSLRDNRRRIARGDFK